MGLLGVENDQALRRCRGQFHTLCARRGSPPTFQRHASQRPDGQRLGSLRIAAVDELLDTLRESVMKLFGTERFDKGLGELLGKIDFLFR